MAVSSSFLFSPLLSSPPPAFLFSPLLSSLHCFPPSREPPVVTFHLCLPNDLTSWFYLPPHPLSIPLSCLPGDHAIEDREKRADSVCPFRLLCFFSPPVFLNLLSSFSLSSAFLYLLVDSLHFAALYLRSLESNPNKQCRSRFTVM